MKNIAFLVAVLIGSFGFSQEANRSLSQENWQFKNAKESQWLKATIPGTVHTDLMANHKIPDPYLDENEKKVQWIENEDWDYKTTFKVSEEEFKNQNIDLVFDGLDTYATVFLNGKKILEADNMFRKWSVPVKKLLKKGDNTLLVKFKSAVVTGKELAKKVPFEMPETPRSFVRKAQYQFGWDWGPRLVTAGIWKDVRLEFWNDAKIQHVQIEQKNLSSEKSDLNFNLDIIAYKSGKYAVQIQNLKKDFYLKKGLNKISIPYTQNHPQYWQPNGWGEAKLYDFKIALLKDRKVLAQNVITHGFRTVELVQKPDQWGKSFYFLVNGKPLYAKGTNWIPGDSFLPRMTAAKYDEYIKAAKDTHMNMIRVWGGGVYEDDEFYKACDRNGILVWQDFMFAGSFYPSDPAFLENVKQEVKDQVERLQNHPSIALWCGNNEVDEAIVNWGYQKQFKYSKADSLQVWKDYRKVFLDLIPNTLNEILPKDHIYWPTSPSIGWGHKESLTEGDSHYWGVWWGEQPFEVYNQKVPRFASEYGFQGMPSIEAFKKMFSGTPDLSLNNPIVQYHQKNDRGWAIIAEYMKRDYVVPEDFTKYDYVSQLLQARGMRIAIEAHRRNQPYNMGTLIWQLNDCWPVVSWSAIDYEGNWKALQYQTKRSFAPQVILGFEENGKIGFYGINDDLKTFKNVALKVVTKRFDGTVVTQLDLKPVETDLEHIVHFESIPSKNLVSDDLQNQAYLEMILTDQEGQTIATNTYFFGHPKDWKLPKPSLKIEKISPTKIRVSTDVVAKNVYLMGDVHYSDNFFDLLPGESKIIGLSKPMEDIQAMSLWDTME